MHHSVAASATGNLVWVYGTIKTEDYDRMWKVTMQKYAHRGS